MLPAFKTNMYAPSLMDQFFNHSIPTKRMYHNGFSSPAINIIENEKDFVLEVAAPGLNKEEFNIELENDVLSISSEIKSENEDSKENYTRKEFNYSSFKRSFTVPESVDGSKIKASHKNGILRVELPKKDEALPVPARAIKIS
jgi:HSP20 family protein